MILTTDIILLILLGAHMVTLRILWDCSRHLTTHGGGISEHLTEFSDGMNEVIRIGSDLCDTVEALSAIGEAQGAVSMQPLNGAPAELDIGNTIMSLIANRVMGGLDGRTEIQERPQEGSVYAETEETKNKSTSEDT
jgi:hypothetical protein